MHIRLATDADLPALVSFADAAQAERGYGTSVDFATKAPLFFEHGILLVAERNAVIIGCFAATVLPDPLTDQPYADQALWYVAPAHRRGRAAIALLDAFEETCLKHGLTRWRVVQPVGCPRLGVHFGRRGYRAIEVTHIKDLTAEPDEQVLQQQRRRRHPNLLGKA